MIGLFRFVLAVVTSSFKSKLRLEAENEVECTENFIHVDEAPESPKLAE
jgi:hypothetical protein